MLNVFHVDGGRMIYLDIGYATGQVLGLQRALQEETTVPPNEQALLVSGGEILDSSKPVTLYGAGTESNPIFLVSRFFAVHPHRSLGISSAIRTEGTDELLMTFQQLRQEFNNASCLTPSFELVQRLAGLAKNMSWNAEHGVDICKRLVEEQHLLHQGWSALVANLEDTGKIFSKRVEKFRNYFTRFSERKPRAREFLDAFDEDLKLLRQIPLPYALVSTDQQKNLGHDSSPSKSLLDWMTAKDTSHSITEVAEEAASLLDQIDDSNLENLQRHKDSVEHMVNLMEMKEIKGISKRLSQLDEFLHRASSIQRDQKELCDAVVQQEQKALVSTRDLDLIKGTTQIQKDTLVKIVQNEQNLTDIASKFNDSKVELLDNIRKRLGDWITETYQLMHEGHNQLTIYGERLTAAKKRLDLLKQIHEAPTIYAAAVTEVLRRKTFSGDFRAWASSLVEKSQKLREEESELRLAFQGKLDRHFLKLLFAGMNDEMPSFCSQNPAPFDQNMPPLTADDLRMLRQSAVSLAPLLQVNQRNIYETLAVPDPRESLGGLKREASFFSQTPPKFLGASRKFPSSTWLSGDENLDFSPTGGLMASSPPTARGLDFEPFGLSEISPVPSGSRDTGSDEKQSTVSSYVKSAPIRIPSRAPSDGMSTSRQLSEKSSRFGTPEEDLPMSGDEISGPSPPEMISRSQLNAEIGQLTDEMLGKVEDLDGREEEASCSGIQANTQTSFNEMVGSGREDLEMLLLDKTKEAEEKEAELLEEKRKINDVILRMESLQNELAIAHEKQKQFAEREEIQRRCQDMEAQLEESRTKQGKLTDVCVAQKLAVSSLVREHSLELKQLKELLMTCSKDNEDCIKRCKEIVEGSGLRLEASLQDSLSQAQESALKLKREEWEKELERLSQQLEVEKEKTRDAEKLAENYGEVIREKEQVQTLLHEQIESTTEKWRQKLEEDKSEIIKQLTIDHELQLDALREGVRNELQEKESAELQLKENLREKNEVIAQLRKEQDLLVASQYERDSRYPSADLESLKREHEVAMKDLRAEMEKEYKDKLQFLTKGMEEKNSALMERCQKEKEVELRMMKEKHTKELDEIRSTQSLTEQPEKTEEPMGESVSGTLPSPGEEVEMIAQSMSESVMPAVTEWKNGDKGVQTRIKMKDMKQMITVTDIREGDTVLVIYSEQHETYVLFSTAPTIYFLKEHFAKKMGIHGMRKACTLAKVVAKPEFCEIKKDPNRYKLPLQTRFFRVEAESLAGS